MEEGVRRPGPPATYTFPLEFKLIELFHIVSLLIQKRLNYKFHYASSLYAVNKHAVST